MRESVLAGFHFVPTRFIDWRLLSLKNLVSLLSKAPICARWEAMGYGHSRAGPFPFVQRRRPAEAVVVGPEHDLRLRRIDIRRRVGFLFGRRRWRRGNERHHRAQVLAV